MLFDFFRRKTTSPCEIKDKQYTINPSSKQSHDRTISRDRATTPADPQQCHPSLHSLLWR